ncbi:hypothetical protein NST54_14695 [Caldifermentibacillus hisashii]|jgi:hypothetical protein|uniref:hypothetical protein n=1 Tax=Bacillaceae TaxID=186817 RepID=UPI000D55193A|nr:MULTISPECIES: hypothetical protein [Bacillaceae]AWI13294.1 hypothetical protein CQJ30_14770 [Caldibacillus thermoamylovorans]MCM3055604.1 hypothetical protein [Caldibacillus thermoamylovorans]MDL0419410.1 hypothetical protein [Caldibacillus thermoamylovorans]MEC5272718.1 hypothetical protein [Caldifermentibacillus hisashii]MED3643190.1 hypothetical protein [Caldifermentibacillus hisashii]
MLYLYFPEDKSEYIPALISFTIFLIFCILTFRWIIKYSKKEELRTKELEEQIKQNLDETGRKR